MKGYLLDTNVISELRKGSRAEPSVTTWFNRQPEKDLYLSVLTVGEISRGIHLIHRRDPAQARALRRWLGELTAQWSLRILPVDSAVAALWGELMTPDPRPVIDTLLAATALHHDLTLATRNLSDLQGCGVLLVNPFEAGS